MPSFAALISATLLILLFDKSSAWGSSDKIKLKDVEVLTLYSGKMTAGRRSAPVPQMKCVGGNAGCNSFVPQVVQCYNRGSDGFDAHWECKTDMDNAFRFGSVQVSCEGYDYPDDPYILKGSCGLEYTLDLTKEGMNGQHSHNYYGGNTYQQSAYTGNYKSGHKSTYFANLACGAVICIIVYAIYKTCISPVEETRQRSSTNQDYPDHRGPGSSPPPPGFRRNYYPDHGSDTFSGGSDSCSGNAGSSGGGGLGSRAGGFWTGAATGGLLGYMFGSRNNTGGYGYNAGYNSGYSQAFPGTSRRSFGGDSWGGGGGGFFSGGGGSSGASSSGTRTASGFGGTSRR